MAAAQRSRYPYGYSGYRPRLKCILTCRRKKLGIKQQTLANDIGITRQTLSAIENGHAWPHWETMDKLAEQLNLQLGDFLKRCEPSQTPRFKNDDDEDAEQRRSDLNAALRAGRRLENLSLEQVAKKCQLLADKYRLMAEHYYLLAEQNEVLAKRYQRLAKKCARLGRKRLLSVAQLSRIERDEVTRSRVYQSKKGSVEFAHPVLKSLVRLGWNGADANAQPVFSFD